MRRDHLANLAKICERLAEQARQDYEFAELTRIARYLEQIKRLPGENGTRGKVRKQIDRTEELIAILLGLEESITNLGRLYHDIPRLEALHAALDLVVPSLNAARHLRGRLVG